MRVWAGSTRCLKQPSLRMGGLPQSEAWEEEEEEEGAMQAFGAAARLPEETTAALPWQW